MQKPITQSSLKDEGSNEVLFVPTPRTISCCLKTAVFEEEFTAYCGAPHVVATNKVITTIHAARLATGAGCVVHYPAGLFVSAATHQVIEALAPSLISIPFHPSLSDEGRSHACAAVNEVV